MKSLFRIISSINFPLDDPKKIPAENGFKNLEILFNEMLNSISFCHVFNVYKKWTIFKKKMFNFVINLVFDKFLRQFMTIFRLEVEKTKFNAKF